MKTKAEGRRQKAEVSADTPQEKAVRCLRASRKPGLVYDIESQSFYQERGNGVLVWLILLVLGALAGLGVWGILKFFVTQ